MDKIKLIATTAFGLETLVKWEVEDLGFEDMAVSNGKVEFSAEIADIPRANMWLRCAGRVQLKMGEFRATTFDELFEQTKALPWEDWITRDGQFTVLGSSVKSQLGSFRACQSIVKKAIVERLRHAYKVSWFRENGPEYTVKVSMLRDVATLTIDTSGSGLHKRGYRADFGDAALKETLAAAMVKLSFYEPERILLDPFCGSGTIPIEAAMLARNIAPGIQRDFASEAWPTIGLKPWKDARREAEGAIRRDIEVQIFGSDIDPAMVELSKNNAQKIGLAEDIVFEEKDVRDVWIDKPYGVVITNPPYGIRMGEFAEINQLYVSLHKTFRKKKGWSVYVLTADTKFPDYFKRAKPNRVRKLFSGPLEVRYYQYYGERPPRDLD